MTGLSEGGAGVRDGKDPSDPVLRLTGRRAHFLAMHGTGNSTGSAGSELLGYDVVAS